MTKFPDNPALPKNIPEAIGYIEAMRTKGKVAMVWEGVEEE